MRTRFQSGRLVIMAALAGLSAAGACGVPPSRGLPADTGTVVASGGVARLPIVIPAGASETLRLAVRDLERYLGDITHSRFEVLERHGFTGAGILVGTPEALGVAVDDPLASALSVKGFDGREAFAIRTAGDRVLLLGATDLAASHAVYRFLEEIGCRWFFPGETWEVVPSIPELKVELNVEDRPAALARSIWFGYGFCDGRHGRCAEEYRTWARRNRMAHSFHVDTSHAWKRIIRAYPARFAAHPEYLALVSRLDELTGEVRTERGGSKLCIGNPEVVELVKLYALEYFAEHPDADMVSVEPSDGGGHCECEACKRLGTISDRVFYLANQVARAVRDVYPDKMVGLMAYNLHAPPPSFPLEPNIHVRIAEAYLRGPYSHDQLWELWPDKCRSLGARLYFSVFALNRGVPPGGKAADLEHLARSIPRAIGLGAVTFSAESADDWGLHGRGYFVANRLMWDPRADVPAILDDFYERAFGPAAGAVRRFHDRFDRGSRELLSTSLMAWAASDLDEAARLAADVPSVIARIDHLKMFLRFVQLQWLIRAERRSGEPDAERRNLLLKELLVHAYRIRFTHMVHWEAIRRVIGREVAAELDDPSWRPRVASVHWKDLPPYEHEEVERFFADGLAAFVPVPVDERSFSESLRPLPLADGPEKVNEDRGFWVGPMRHVAFSPDGAPLRFTLVAGLIEKRRDGPPLRWSVSTPTGEAVRSGVLPLDGAGSALEVPVPGAGRYYVDVLDYRTGWRIVAPAAVPLTIVLRRDRPFGHPGRGDDMYFYVPAETRRIQYYWAGNPHTVYGPDGKVLRRVTESHEIITVDVPEGADGRVWRLGHLSLHHLWFFNLPPYVARSPGALLVPEDLWDAVKGDHPAARH